MDGSATNLSGVILCNPFKWVILLFISSRKSGCCCVCASTANWILFLNHRNRKVVGGTHNILVHYVDDAADDCAPNLSGVVLCNPFKWDILLFISGQKPVCLCVCINSKTNFIPLFCCSFLIKICYTRGKVDGLSLTKKKHFLGSYTPALCPEQDIS